ncbi:GNAT family N-acetyltransferase [Paraburkholderia sp. RP-4-7]|uniref:GNAT family N-acetyltransferase n=1 Tax=Paraburkholderia polaris TaxID=2728848 RepID=A0A848IU53_9BURK|nr:GNAT family N-acetyltransferase [Paraburkholderia polaris]
MPIPGFPLNSVSFPIRCPPPIFTSIGSGEATTSLTWRAYIEGKQIAFARLITDQATFAYLCDVFVLPAYRGNGYASALMKHVFASPSLTGLRRIVLVTTDAHHVYKPHGFKGLTTLERYMELHNPHVYKTA